VTESSIWWIDTLPDIAEDGSTKTPHDHIVKRVAPSLNSMSIAVSRVSITQYPTDNDSYIDLRNDCHGNVSILSNSLSVIDDGSGNVIIKAGEV
jgi:hypothetical protein